MPDFAGRILHVREFYDADADERIGWAFAIQGPDYLAVEELYVRPQFRRRGYGARLLVTLKELSHQTGLSLWFYIPFADSKRENLGVAERLLAKESYYLFPSGVRWCPLIALHPVSATAISLSLPAPPALCSPRSRLTRNGLPLPVIEMSDSDLGDRAAPVSESNELLKQPDWKSESDEAFLAAAKATFHQYASLLRRLA